MPIDYESLYDIQDQLEDVGKGGGGGGRKGGNPIGHGNKTVREIEKQNIENAKENRMEDAIKEIHKELETIDLSSEEDRNRYLEWLSANFSKGYGEDLYQEKELEEKMVRASGPGGQNVNKVNSAVEIKHLPTGIEVKNKESRNQPENRDAAREHLNGRLGAHIDSWKNIIGESYNEGRITNVLSEIID